MKRKCIPALLAIVAVNFTLMGQSSIMLGPLSGYIEDVPTQSVRSIIGVPGGAYLGPPVLQNIERAWLSPAGDRAVVLRASRYHLVSGLNTSDPKALALQHETVESEAMQVAWSSDGLTVAVASGGQLHVALWMEKESQWLSETPLSLPAETITALAVESKDGAVAFATAADAEGSVYARWNRNETPQLLTRTGRVGALVYARNGETLYISDRTAGVITGMTRSGQGVPVGIAAEPERYRDVVALAVGADDRTLYSVHQERRQIITHNLMEGSKRAADLEGKPNGMLSLPQAGLYVVAVRENSSGTILVFDSRIDAFYFIPAGGVQ